MGFNLGKLFKHGVKAIATPFSEAKDLLSGGGGGEGRAGAFYKQALANQQQSAATAQIQQRKGATAIRAGYGQAKTLAGDAFSGARLNAQDTGQVNQAQAAQSLSSRGLTNTTVLDNARSGISGGVTRQMADIDAQYAQLIAGLNTGEAGALAQNAGNQAALTQAQSGQNSALLGSYASQIQEEDPNAWLNSLLGLAGTAVGVGIGKNL